ncbi:MAG: neutral/alkaline non-lysosomal ceramidase N-terminal domain-containing protein [Pirellulaceae bacterium]|nr:neutral/alkaline non-lysosomal ceramidase N-terminal domain-containing protein [Planctomycetales bacterium]
MLIGIFRIRFIPPLHLVFCFVLTSSPPLASTFAGQSLEVGVAVRDVTPPVPYRMSGYFSERVSTGIRDPLQAKAIVFRQSQASAALVFCDLIGISRDVSHAARRSASKRSGIPYENIAIIATHSHTGPLYFGALRKMLHDRSVATLGTDPYETTDYSAELVEHLVQVIEQAQRALAPSALASGSCELQGLSFNRRFFMKDGTVRFNPGQLNPEIVRPCGPIDPEVTVIAFQKVKEAQPFAGLSSFALHLDTVGGTEYSADYPRFVEEHLRESFGSQFHSLFGTGTCGDINHIDVSTSTRPSTEEIGKRLGQHVEACLRDELAIDSTRLAVRSRSVEVPLQVYSPEEISEAASTLSELGLRKIAFLDSVKAYKIMALQLRGGATIQLEVQVFQLGDETAIVTLPGEVFVEFGLAIKQASPFKRTLVIELANDAPGYIPTQKAFVEGSYETVNSRIATGGGEAMVKLAIEMLRELK